MHRLSVLLALTATAFSQTPATDPDANAPAASPAQNRTLKQLPPLGVAISEKDRAELTAGAAELGKEIAVLKLAKLHPELSALIPDVEIFHKAVDWALRYDEFYDVKQIATARTLLAEGRARAAALRDGKAPWTAQTGLVVRGYRSKIDGSVQPFGVVVPATWKGAEDKKLRPTWVWNHGRNDKLSELAFIAERMNKPGEFTPEDTFVVHPYGRYCNATKFAGEVDVFEALDSASRAYPVDRGRLVNAGFSMGGASAWHLAVHHPGMWAASHAGAGFAESAEYAGVFSEGKTPPPWWEVILYRWYDATVCAGNLANHPMFAYYGSEDKQKQATEIMRRFAEKEGVKFEEFIGPGVGHKYEPKMKQQIADNVAALLATRPAEDDEMHLVTYTLHYPSVKWVRIDGMERQWERAEIHAKIDAQKITATTKNVTALVFSSPFRSGAPDSERIKQIIIDGQALAPAWNKVGAQFVKTGGRWAVGIPQGALSKQPGISGPVDDAFTSPFIFVKPTGAPLNSATGEWTQRELTHATKQWRSIYRGDAPAKNDSEIAAADLQENNLILWGDPSSNAVLKKIADKLPVKWSADGVEFGGKKYGANHVPVLIFPNPLNPHRYVVLNSGFTFSRAAASGTNSLQTPKLPDWAIVDISIPPDDKFPGKIVDAGFFDEQWKFTTERPK